MIPLETKSFDEYIKSIGELPKDYRGIKIITSCSFLPKNFKRRDLDTVEKKIKDYLIGKIAPPEAIAFTDYKILLKELPKETVLYIEGYFVVPKEAITSLDALLEETERVTKKGTTRLEFTFPKYSHDGSK